MNLGWCEGVTEEGVQILAHCCSNLEVLDLCGCVKASLSKPLHAVLLCIAQRQQFAAVQVEWCLHIMW